MDLGGIGMKLCRFRSSESTGEPARYGIVEADRVHEARGEWPGSLERTGQTWPLDAVQLLAPVAPSKIVCVARNYQKHAAELGNTVPAEPLIFLKAPSSVIGPSDSALPARRSPPRSRSVGIDEGRRHDTARAAP